MLAEGDASSDKQRSRQSHLNLTAKHPLFNNRRPQLGTHAVTDPSARAVEDVVRARSPNLPALKWSKLQLVSHILAVAIRADAAQSWRCTQLLSEVLASSILVALEFGLTDIGRAVERVLCGEGLLHEG
jgi:hypothetical protein